MDILRDFPYPFSKNFKLLKVLTDKELESVCCEIQTRMQSRPDQVPKVSIIIPAYNEELYLPVMLWGLSRIKTSYPIEIIGVDNGSTDRTSMIMKKCGLITITEGRKGVSYARQAGLAIARGELVASTDADTIVPEGWIDASLGYFNHDPTLVALSGGSLQSGAHWSDTFAKVGIRCIRLLLGYPENQLDIWVGHNTFFFREIACRVGGYEPGTDQGEDALIVQKMSHFGSIKSTQSDPSIRVHTSSRRISSFTKVVKKLLERVYMLRLSTDTILPGKTFSDVR